MRPASTTTRCGGRSRHPGRRSARLVRTVRVWSSPVGALAAALLSFWTGGVHIAALAVMAALFLVSVPRARIDARDPLGPGPGFLAPMLAVAVLTGSGLGALEGLLWGGFVRVFLLEQARA